MPLRTYSLSVWIVTSHGRLSADSASITAVSSMRLLVVSASPPKSSFSCVAPAQPRAPAAAAGVALAGAVGVDDDVLRTAIRAHRDGLALRRRCVPAMRHHRRRGVVLGALALGQADQPHAAHALHRDEEVDRAEHRPPALAGRAPSSRSAPASAASASGGR